MASLKNTVQITLAQVEKLLLEDKSVSVTLKLAIKALIGLVHPMAGQLGLKSNNSSIPPSQDPNRTKKEAEQGTQEARRPTHSCAIRDASEVGAFCCGAGNPWS